MPPLVPANVFAPCPRCNILRTLIGTGTAYLCGACEWAFTASTVAPTGTGTGAVTTASTAITVASGGAAFTNGMSLLYDTAANAEIVRVSGVPTGTSVPVAKFYRAHGGGAAFGQLLLTPSQLASERVPPAAGWGF
jgi:hypothetical protein